MGTEAQTSGLGNFVAVVQHNLSLMLKLILLHHSEVSGASQAPLSAVGAGRAEIWPVGVKHG